MLPMRETQREERIIIIMNGSGWSWWCRAVGMNIQWQLTWSVGMVCWHGLLTWSVVLTGGDSVEEQEDPEEEDPYMRPSEFEEDEKIYEFLVKTAKPKVTASSIQCLQISLTTIWLAACGNRNRSLQTSKAPLENQAQGTNLFASYCCLLPDSSKGRWWWLTGLIITTRLTLSVLLTLLFSLLLLTPVLGVCGLTS